MDSAMCLRCEVVVATVSHSQSHSHSQSTSPKFSHGFCFYFCNILFRYFFLGYAVHMRCQSKRSTYNIVQCSITHGSAPPKASRPPRPPRKCLRSADSGDCRKVFTYTNLNFSFYFHILYSDVGVDVVLVATVVVVAVFLVDIVIVASYHSHLV